jgi:choloylglycine hydrolase
MEFGTDMHTQLRTSTKGRAYQFQTTDGKPAAQWVAQYGYIFLDALDQDVAVDGMNEAGLSIEGLYLPGETQYQTVPVGSETKGVPYYAFGDWILSQFKTVDEVRAALANVYVFEQKLAGFQDRVFPLHISIFDASGKGIVVEFVKGQQKVYDNELGVMTNSPQYDWQVVNLRNYVNLTASNPTPVDQGGMTFTATGQGAGLMGLPGDFTPPSRFVKMAKLMQFADKPANAQSALNLAQHMMNNVDIPLGTVSGVDHGQTVKDYTQWVVFKDLSNKKLYYRTYDNMTIRGVSMSSLDFSKNAPRLKMAIDVPEFELDVSDSFKSMK